LPLILSPATSQALVAKKSLKVCLPISINLAKLFRRIRWVDGMPIVGMPDRASSQGLPVLYEEVASHSWVPVGNQSATSDSINACLSDFASYQIFAPIMNQPYTFGEVYVFPNPTGPGQTAILHVDVGMSEKVSYRIYDVSGDLVTEGKMVEAPQAIRGRSAYEQPLDMSHFKAGVYVGVVTAEKSGSDALRKNFRFSILK
jgi:hypothetical protein